MTKIFFNKNISIIALTFFLLISIFYPFFSLEAQTSYSPLAPIKSGDNVFVGDTVSASQSDFTEYLNGMFRMGIAIAVGLAVVMIIIGGVEYMSTDAIGKKEDGQSRINAALLGLVVALGSYMLLNTLSPDLLKTKLTLEDLDRRGFTLPTEGSGTMLPNGEPAPRHGIGARTDRPQTEEPERVPPTKPEEQTPDFDEEVPGGYKDPPPPGQNQDPCTTDQNTTATGKATAYYTALESDYASGPKTAAFRDRNGRVLAQVSPSFLRAARIEGSARLNDGRVLNYESYRNGEIKWRVSNTQFGEGSRGNALVPYRTVAADPRYYSYGQRLFVRELNGVRLPDGTTHNGYVTVGDVGSAIKGNGRLDLFTGAGKGSIGRDIDRITDRPINVTKCAN